MATGRSSEQHTEWNDDDDASGTHLLHYGQQITRQPWMNDSIWHALQHLRFAQHFDTLEQAIEHRMRSKQPTCMCEYFIAKYHCLITLHMVEASVSAVLPTRTSHATGRSVYATNLIVLPNYPYSDCATPLLTRLASIVGSANNPWHLTTAVLHQISAPELVALLEQQFSESPYVFDRLPGSTDYRYRQPSL